MHLPCREGGYHELEVFFRDRDREIGEADLAVLVDLGRLATVVIDHSRTADALRSSELRYRTLAQQLPAIVYVTNPMDAPASPTPTASATCSAIRRRSGRPIRRRSGSGRSTPTTSRG